MRALATLLVLLGWAVLPTSAQACKYPPGPEGSYVGLIETQNLGVASAGFTHATSRYRHGVLGDDVEGGGLIVLARKKNGRLSTPCLDYIVLSADRVFEDLAPRIVDVDGDGWNDVVVVESQADSGAALAVYSYLPDVEPKQEMGRHRGRLRKIASTPHIGRRNRWLAPAGIADFDGDGQNDIAYVETPHIGGTLRIWTMRDGKLVQIASKRGFSNHRIGEDFITGGVRDCGQGPELVLPNFDWSRLMVARMTNDGIATRAIGTKTGKAAVGAALACQK